MRKRIIGLRALWTVADFRIGYVGCMALGGKFSWTATIFFEGEIICGRHLKRTTTFFYIHDALGETEEE